MIMAPARLSNSEAERLRAFERQGHDALAKSYHAFFAPVTALAIQPLFEAVRLRPGIRLLDIASGPGALAAEAAKRSASAVGVDLSPQMIELARRIYPGIDFREADVERLPFGDNTFGAVVCAFGLGHFPRPEAAVAEAARTLLPGGRIAFSWWDDPSRQRIRQSHSKLALAGNPPERSPYRRDVRDGAKSGNDRRRFPCPVYPQKQTWRRSLKRSAKGRSGLVSYSRQS
jgi:SAM-dependent methyltransferase